MGGGALIHLSNDSYPILPYSTCCERGFASWSQRKIKHSGVSNTALWEALYYNSSVNK